MEVAEKLDNSIQLNSDGGSVAIKLCNNHGLHALQANGVGDVAPEFPSLRENQSPSTNDDNKLDDWSRRRPESVWLEYLYAWNPLAAGSYDNGYFLQRSNH